MGEAKQEESKEEVKQESKKEEKKEEKQEENKEEKTEEKKEEAKPSPPPTPIVLFVDLHCVGCAKKIKRIILKCKGVEDVKVEMLKNQVTVKGIVDSQELCSRIQKKAFRQAKIISPLPPAEGDTKPAAVPALVSEISTVELLVNMHCEACAEQLKRKILKMKGVQTAEIDFGAGKVTVTGTMDGERLAKYIHRRTGKLASIVPPPPPPPPKEEEKKEEPENKPEDQKPPQEKKEESAEQKKEEEKPPEKEEKAEGKGDGSGDQKKEAQGEAKSIDTGNEDDMMKRMIYHVNGGFNSEEDMMKRMIYWNGGVFSNEEDMMRRMMYWNIGNYGSQDETMAKRTAVPVHWNMPIYVIQRPPPPPQLFSDENPNACCIQ